MAIVFLNVNGYTSVVKYAGFSPSFNSDISSFYTMIDDSVPLVSDLLADVNAHKYSDIMGTNPYVTAYYDGANITIQFVNGTAPSTLSFSLFGKTYSVPVSSGKATIPIKVHPSIANHRVNVTFNVSGYPQTSIELGGFQQGSVQAYTDASGTIQVVPTDSVDLANYWTSKYLDSTWMIADLDTITGLLANVLFQYVIPALNLNLSADENNGLNDIKNNILPNIVSTLANIAPVNGTNDIHYASYKYHLAQAKTAMDSYTNDRNEIMKYTTLK